MTMNGVETTNISDVFPVSDQVLVNRNGSTGLQNTSDLATQVGNSSAIAGAIAGATAQVDARVNALDARVGDVEGSMATLGGAIVTPGKVYSTSAAMAADLTPAAGTLAQVTIDPNFANNEFLKEKVGGPGAGLWAETSIPAPALTNRRLDDLESEPRLTKSLMAGNADKYDALQIVDANNQLVLGASQYDGEMRVGRHVHKPVLALEDRHLPPGFPCYLSGNDIVVVHENGAMTIAGTPWVFSACGPGSRFVSASWNKPAFAAPSSVQIDRNAQMFVPYGAQLAFGIIGIGQSLMAGSSGVPANWVNPNPDYILMPYTGPASDVRLGLTVSSGTADVLSPGKITGLTPMQSRSGAVSVTYGQTPIETLCGAMHEDIMWRLGFAPRLIGMSLGVGGIALADLQEGSQADANLIVAAADTKAAALANGWRYWGLVIYSRHGETDAANINYAPEMLTLRNSLNTRLKAVTGQAADVMIVMAQPSSFGDGLDAAVLAMRTLHRDHPDKFFVSHPSYMLDFDINTTGSADDDNVHLSARGYAMDGEYGYKGVKRAIFAKTPGETFRMLSATIVNSTTIDVVWAVPVKPLVLDTVTVSERVGTVKGFEYTDDSGSPPAISSVVVSAPNTTRITLAAPMVGGNRKVRYALKGHVASPRIASERPRGNLRDSDLSRARFDPSVILYNWAIHDEFAVA